MTTCPMTNTTGPNIPGPNVRAAEQPRFDRSLRWIGDLDHPFYSDERNRFVWYEASAIGFQLVLIGSFLTVGLSLWVGGSAALPYCFAMMAPQLLALAAFQLFLKRHSAEYVPVMNDFKRRRGQVALAAYAFMISGLARALLDLNTGDPDSRFARFADGAFTGFLVGIPFAIIGFFLVMRRKAEAAERTES